MRQFTKYDRLMAGIGATIVIMLSGIGLGILPLVGIGGLAGLALTGFALFVGRDFEGRVKQVDL